MKLLPELVTLIEHTQPRVSTGDDAQRKLVACLRQTYPNLKIGRATYAAPGSQGLDIGLKINDQQYKMEVKSRDTRHRLVQIFSETVYRGQPGNLTAEFLEDLGYPPNLTIVIDKARKTDQTVGFAGDPGVQTASGKMPQLPAPNRQVLQKYGNVYQSKLKQEGINYFVTYTEKDKTVDIRHTGLGQNILNAMPITAPQYLRLDTAGSADYPKSIRSTLKARFS